MSWVTSSFSGSQGNCLHLRRAGGWIEIRDSERPDEVIRCSAESLAAFIAGVKAGEFDHLAGDSAVEDPAARALTDAALDGDESGIVVRVPRGWIS
jgi:hypothetical protein